MDPCEETLMDALLDRLSALNTIWRQNTPLDDSVVDDDEFDVFSSKERASEYGVSFAVCRLLILRKLLLFWIHFWRAPIQNENRLCLR